MISKTTFPNINDDLFSEFARTSSDHVRMYMSETVPEATSKQLWNLENWQKHFESNGISSQEALCSEILSHEFLRRVDGWLSSMDGIQTTPYSFEADIPFDKSTFYSSLPSDYVEIVLDINADTGEIADTSPSSYLVNVEWSSGITIGNDPMYGKVIHFEKSGDPNSEDNISSVVDHYPYIKVSKSAKEEYDKLKFNVDGTVDGDNYLMVVFGRLGSQRDATLTFNGDSLESSTDLSVGGENVDYTFLERNSIDRLESAKKDILNLNRQFTFKVHTSDWGSGIQLSTNPTDGFDSVGVLSTIHNTDFYGDGARSDRAGFVNYLALWTMYAAGFGTCRHLEGNEDRMWQRLWINPVSHQEVPAQNQIGTTNGSRISFANFPGEIWSLENQIHQTANAQNSPMVYSNTASYDMIFRLKEFSEDEDLTSMTNFQNFQHDNETLWIGTNTKVESLNGNLFTQTIRYFNDADIKFIRIYKLKHSFGLPSGIASKEYRENVLEHRLNSLLCLDIDADSDSLPEDFSDLITSDSSIAGNYFHFEQDNSPTITDDAFGINPFDTTLSNFIAFETWISCDDFSTLSIGKREDDLYEMTFCDAEISTVASRFHYKDATTISSNINAVLRQRPYNRSGNESLFVSNSGSDKFAFPFKISDDRRWHHIVFCWLYPLEGAYEESEDSFMANFITYIDGVSRCGTPNSGSESTPTCFVIQRAKDKGSFDGLSGFGKTFKFNPYGQKFNMKSFRVYAGKMPIRFLQNQDFLGMYLKGLSELNLDRDRFTTNMYVVDSEVIPFYPNNRNDMWDLWTETYMEKNYAVEFPNWNNLYYPWSSKEINFVGTYMLSSVTSSYSEEIPETFYKGLSNATDFPNIMCGYPYCLFGNSLRPFFVEISGEIFLGESGNYLVHTCVDDGIFLKFKDSGGNEVSTFNNGQWQIETTIDGKTYETWHSLKSLSTDMVSGPCTVTGFFVETGASNSFGASYCLVELYKLKDADNWSSISSDPSELSTFYNNNINDFHVLTYGETYPTLNL